MEMSYGWKKAIVSVLMVGLLSPLLSGCGGQPQESMPEQSYPGSAPAKKPGMTRGQKTAVLAGAAALYYLYQHRQKTPPKAKGATGQLYRSESTGGIYYRDAQGKAIWVSPPAGGIQVPEEEARVFQTKYQNEIARTKYREDAQPLKLSAEELAQYLR